MVAAKLDHSMVLVTKFHQNRSTLRVEVKIMALEVCNRANRQTDNDDCITSLAEVMIISLFVRVLLLFLSFFFI